MTTADFAVDEIAAPEWVSVLVLSSPVLGVIGGIHECDDDRMKKASGSSNG